MKANCIGSENEIPFFSICIPQYNRTSFLIKAIESFVLQSYKSFELCISDGGSTDNRVDELLHFLKSTNLKFTFNRSNINLRYDENLRQSIELARGRYCLLMGNDDDFLDNNVLAYIYQNIQQNNFPGSVITNYKEYGTGKIFNRIKNAKIIGCGPDTAIGNFRNYSFVSGIVLDRQLCWKHTTKKWDGFEMYQMYLATRIVAEGSCLLGLDRVVIGKDIQIPGQIVDSYAKQNKIKSYKIEVRPLPMNGIPALVVDAVVPFLKPKMLNWAVTLIYAQVYVFTYPFWVIEYKRVQSLLFSFGICLAMSPSRIAKNIHIGFFTKCSLWLLYYFSTLISLITPVLIFDFFKPLLYRFAKR